LPDSQFGTGRRARFRHIGLALAALPGLLRSRAQRRCFAEMRALCRQLPQLLQQPLPQAMEALAAVREPCLLDENQVRRLADVAALVARRSPLGFCLRRSLLRYHFLNRAGLPLGVAYPRRARLGAIEWAALP
jgi:hypothetical protein